MWMILQLLVAFAVASAIIYFDSQTGGATGGPAIGVLAFGAAWLVTYGVSWCLDRRKRSKAELGN
jgi:hypothetical protein